MPARLVIPVWMDAWQYACCGDGDDGQEVVVAGTGDLVVHLPGAGPSARHIVGLLAAESHGGVGPGDPPTRARVQAIRIVSWRYEERPPGSSWHVPVPDSATLTDVLSSDRGDLDCQGFLVTLDVAGRPPLSVSAATVIA